MVSGKIINKTNPLKSYSFSRINKTKEKYEKNIRALFKNDVIEFVWEAG